MGQIREHLAADLSDAVIDLTQAFRSSHALNAHAGTSLVEEVNGLIRQEAVIDVVVTDAAAPESFVEALREQEIEVVVAAEK